MLDLHLHNMTFEELNGDYSSQERMDSESVGRALEEVLSAALPQGCITVGVYEAAKSLNIMDSESVGRALEEVLSAALPQGCITVGVYEAAKSLINIDPDNVVLCILATEGEEVTDVALQIYFTLIQAFCCENHINILRVNNTRRLAELLEGAGGEPMDLHFVLVTSPPPSSWKDPALSKVNRFCSERRLMDQWVPVIHLPER